MSINKKMENFTGKQIFEIKVFNTLILTLNLNLKLNINLNININITLNLPYSYPIKSGLLSSVRNTL